MQTRRELPTDPYRPRRTQSLGVRELAGWTVKLIGITATGDLPNEIEVDAAARSVQRHLPQPVRTPTRPGVAFVIVHRGTEALWAILGWWELDILYHRLFRADLGSNALQPVPPDGPTACVLELLAIDHERQSWVTHVLTRPADPDLAGYLASTLTVDGAA
jgi:hypothetical protein